MVRCPLCGKRRARRDCPARSTRICSVCCGTKREVEIDCPSDCEHLAAGRAWESGRAQPPPRQTRFTGQFLEKHGAVISALAQAVVEERTSVPALLDSDVRATLSALQATVRTLDSGLYYETRPEGSFAAVSLYRRLKGILDDWMNLGSTDRPALKVSDAMAVLDFLVSTHEAHGSERPRSRRYLDWLTALVPADSSQAREEPRRLIVP